MTWQADQDALTADMHNRFGHHPVRSIERERAHAHIREEIQTCATQVARILPEGRERSLAITKFEEAMFWANAALARAHDPHTDD